MRPLGRRALFRGSLRGIVGAAAALMLPMGPTEGTSIGYVSVRDPATQRLAQQLRCYLDGVEITGSCYAANDIEGWADCFVWGADGRVLVRNGAPVEERRRGRVLLVPRGKEVQA